MNGASIPVPSGPPAGRPPTALPDGSPDELAAALPPGNVVVLGGPGSGKTALLEAAMHRLLARPGGTARLLTSSRQAALASTERLLAALTTAAGGALGCVTWYAFARGLVTSHADLLHYRGEPRPLSGPEQWALVRSLLQLDPPEVDWGELAPLVDTRAFTDELAELVLACERRVIDPDELLARARAEDRASWAHAAAFLTVYHDHLALQDAVDQAGLVVQAGDLLEDRPDVLAATVAQGGPRRRPGGRHRRLPRGVTGRAARLRRASGRLGGAAGAQPATRRPRPGRGPPPAGRRHRPRRRPRRGRHHHRRGRPLSGPGRGGRGRGPAAARGARTRRRPLRAHGRAAAVHAPARRARPPRAGALRGPLPARGR